jgi:3-hydroxyisobutyrate dehydrogenase
MPGDQRRSLANSGEITVLVGGDEAVYQRVAPLLQAMGGQIIYMGKLGNASVVKVVTNMLAFIHLVAASEAMMVPAKYGVDPDATYRAIRASSGNSFVHETESKLILSGSYNVKFTMDLACGPGPGQHRGRTAGAGQHDPADFHACARAVRWQCAIT